MHKIRSLINLKYLFFLAIIFFVYRYWFLNKEIIGGDWLYFFNENLLQRFAHFPTLWSGVYGNGLGGEILAFPLDSYLYFLVSTFVVNLHFSWVFTYKVFLFGVFLGLSVFSSIYLFKTIFNKDNLWQAYIASIVFTTNTYILMVAGGGQIGVALAYSLTPLVIARFIKILESKSFRNSVMAGMLLSLQIYFDPRLAYISSIALLLLFIYRFLYVGKIQKKLFIYFFIIPLAVSFLLNVFWILKILVVHTSAAYQYFQMQSSVGIFKYFSFGTFSQSISLLHPNWPDNIFGKTHFMMPEFLILPIIAFLALIFIKVKEDFRKDILFFSLLLLLGAFLAKGSADPLSILNVWIYAHLPGFTVFRDSTKFYALVAVSYSILIPYSISIINEKFIKNVIFVVSLFSLIWLFLISPAIFGTIGGTFKSNKVPADYVTLKNFLYNQKDFSRTLWVPRIDRYTFYSNDHPFVEASSLFNTSNLNGIIKDLQNPKSQKFISDLGIKYIVVPYDPLGEIFVNDRKYDNKIYQNTSASLAKIYWLRSISGFGRIKVFEIPNHKDHFWINSVEAKISYIRINDGEYTVHVKNASKGSLLVFSESYVKDWQATTNGFVIRTMPFDKTLNSFVLPKNGSYELRVYYEPQKYVDFGLVISGIALLAGLGYLAIGLKSDKI